MERSFVWRKTDAAFKNFNRCNNAVTRTTHRAAMIFRKHQYSARASAKHNRKIQPYKNHMVTLRRAIIMGTLSNIFVKKGHVI